MQPDDQKANISTAVGPGTHQIAERSEPTLNGLDENYYVEIVNPLSVDFVGRVASSRPVNAPVRIVLNKNTPTITQNEEDIRRNYGLDLRNPDHKSNQHFAQTVTIPAGKTIRLPGNEAQVIIRQLVNILMDREGKQLFKGDSFARKQIEDRVIVKQGTMSEFFTSQNLDMKKVINKDLELKNEEESFPGEAEPTPGTGVTYQPSGDRASEPASGNRRGRPPKNSS